MDGLRRQHNTFYQFISSCVLVFANDRISRFSMEIGKPTCMIVPCADIVLTSDAYVESYQYSVASLQSFVAAVVVGCLDKLY